MIPFEHYSPQYIAETIKKSIIGQDEPIKTVATVLSTHLARCKYNMGITGTEKPIQADNLLILGPTGTGKTESIRTVIRELNLPIPVAVIAVNTLSNAGYKGRSVDTILEDLIQDAKRLFYARPGTYITDKDCIVEENNGKKIKKIIPESGEKVIVELCNHGIIILDEFDKLSFSAKNEYEAVYSKKLQCELLKIVEGGKGFSENELAQKIDTSDILFVCMGAFTNLLNPPPEPAAIGFFNTVNKDNKTIGIPTTKQIAEFGFVEELLGRVPVRCRYNALTINNLYKILTESKISPVDDFYRLFLETGNKLVIDNSALREIAKKAYEVQAGARGLRTIMGDILYPILYDIDGKYRYHNIRITKKTVMDEESPVITQSPDSPDAYLEKIKKIRGEM